MAYSYNYFYLLKDKVKAAVSHTCTNSCPNEHLCNSCFLVFEYELKANSKAGNHPKVRFTAFAVAMFEPDSLPLLPDEDLDSGQHTLSFNITLGSSSLVSC